MWRPPGVAMPTEDSCDHFHELADMVVVTDDDLACCAANAAFEKTTGWAPRLSTAPSLIDLIHADDAAQMVEVLGALAEGRSRVGIIARLRTIDHTFSWGEWSARRAGGRIYFVIRSADERIWRSAIRNAEQELLDAVVRGRGLKDILILACRHLEALIPGSLSSVLLLDATRTRFRGGAAPSLPQAYTDALHDLAVGPDVGCCGTAVHFRRVVIVEDISTDPLWTGFRELAATHGLRACWSTPLLGGNGEPLGTFAVYRSQPHRPAERELEAAALLSNVVAVAIERHADQVQLIEARIAAEAANRAKSDFLTYMSHELRTPLNAILGFSDAIVSNVYGAKGLDRYRDYARDIHGSGKLLLSMIDRLLDLARLEAGKFEVNEEIVDLDAVLSECVRLVEPPGIAPSRIVIQRVARDVRLVADRQAVTRILLNLLSNAVKFTPGDGAISVTVARAGDALKLTVKDSGIGIAAAEVPQLGKPFLRLNQSHTRQTGGTGLGLFITRSLVELHGGAMTIDSELGVGTLVSVTFPATRLSFHDTAA